MKKNRESESGLFNPRILCAFSLCSCGVFLGMFSLAATPLAQMPSAAGELVRFPIGEANSLPYRFQSLPNTFSSSANQLPPEVPLPSGTRLSLNNRQSNRQSDPSNANQQPAPLSEPQPAALTPNAFGAGSMPLSSTAQSAWSIVNSPNPIIMVGQARQLDGVACTSASDCWAVGYYVNNSGLDQTLIERWDGASWAIVSSPNAGGGYNFLSSVTCMSASDCWAVGGYDHNDYKTLIERWDGTSWAIVSSPNTSVTDRNALLGVTCVSASECWAVGLSRSGSDPYQPLIERWDGSSWFIVSSPTSSGHGLQGVTCASASECWAVGDPWNFGFGNQNSLIERWDGNSWSIVSASTGAGDLLGVTCTSASDCWAVGSTRTSDGIHTLTLIEHWDGSSWTIVTSPNPSPTFGTDTPYIALRGVTCASASECWAVGQIFASCAGYDLCSTGQTLIERWDGGSWAIVTSPNANQATPPFPSSNAINGVTCVAASQCWAVGDWADDTYYSSRELFERWDGTSWTIADSQPPPTQPEVQQATFFGSTCLSASDCWTVGEYDVPIEGIEVQSSLIEHWDGSSWSIVSSPNGSALDNALSSVTCISASDCWAVGSDWSELGQRDAQTLIEHWDGTSWVVVTSPNGPDPMASGNNLYGVTCTSASECWAVGFYNAPELGSQTLIERWNGTSWSVVPSVDSSLAQQGYLEGVTCASGSDCWAVGAYVDVSGYQTLIERWDGTAWTIVPSPNSSALDSDILFGVACASGSDCWAAGAYRTQSPLSGSLHYQTLMEHWDGTLWSIVSSPSATTANDNALYGVACVSASECWAVGTDYASPYQTLIESWNGNAWSIVSSPNLTGSVYGNADNRLWSVACASASECWAVGSGGELQLTEHYGPPVQLNPVQLNEVASRKAHGSAGTFDVDLPLTGSPGIECRSGGANGDYTLIFTFANPLTSVGSASVTSGTGLVTASNIDYGDLHNYIVNLTGVTNAQVLRVSLTNVSDSAGDFSSAVSATMGVLVGDVNASGIVTSGDTNLCKAQALQPVTNANFRCDVNASGAITTGDVNIIKQNALSHL
jgi:hypothetical protein